MTITAPKGLFEAAHKVMQRAYAPFSKYQVGCSILATDGQIYAGCNVENSCYALGKCAEAGAISLMVASGAREIAAVLVLANHDMPCTPCGGCRQLIREFAAQDVPIFCANQHEVVSVHSVEELLPYSFGPTHMGASYGS